MSLDFLARQLGIPLQLRDFFSKDLTASLGSAVQSGYYVGESMISGVMCDHLALRGEKEDVQVWIARGDEPVPRRIVTTYRQIEGQPQFWAQFTDWNFSPELSDTTFTFSAPDPQGLVSWPCRTVVVAVQKLLRQIMGKRNFFWLLAALLVVLLGVPFAGEFGNYGFHPGQV